MAFKDIGGSKNKVKVIPPTSIMDRIDPNVGGEKTHDRGERTDRPMPEARLETGSVNAQKIVF